LHLWYLASVIDLALSFQQMKRFLPYFILVAGLSLLCGCGGSAHDPATSQTIQNTNPPSSSNTQSSNTHTFSNLHQDGGWKGYAELPSAYNICKSCAPSGPEVIWWMTQGIKSPSMSGDATQFNLAGTTPYADVLWTNPLIGQGASQGLPDSSHTLLPTLHNFTYDAYFYATDLSVAQALEFDVNMYFNGLGLIWGNQCRIAGGNEWDIWDNIGQHWSPTGVACNPINNSWNHVTIQVQRESDNSLLFQSITLNGVTSPINRHYPPGSVPGNWWGITVNYQMDGNFSQQPYSVWLDKFNFTYW
jgi:hypothetical protein